MSRALTEEKVLKTLGIENFRQLTKDKVIQMASMLDKMDPEVAKKVLDQFPDFASTMRELLVEYKGFLVEGLKANKENTKSVMESCDATIQACQTILDKDELTFDEKREVLTLMLEITKIKDDACTKDKQFILSLVGAAFLALGLTTTALLAVLGGNSKIDLDSIKKIK